MKKPKFISIEGLFPDLFKIIPGWLKGVFHCVTAGSGVGKTKFSKYAFLFHGYNYCRANNLPFYCLYFCLEESIEKFWVTIQCDLISEKFGLELTYYQYKGYHEGFTKEHQEALDAVADEIAEMKKVIFPIDHVFNPTGIYKTVMKFMDTIGTRKDGVVDSDEFGNKWSSFDYTYDNPDTQVMVIVDHMKLVTPEKNPFAQINTTFDAINKLAEYVVKFICKKYQVIFLAVHQQESSGDNLENVRFGSPEPSLNKLGVNKIVQQEYAVVIGLFNPERVKGSPYHSYNPRQFDGNIRFAYILKHRDGLDNFVKGMWFHGKTSKFEELPKSDKREEIEQFLKNKENGTR